MLYCKCQVYFLYDLQGLIQILCRQHLSTFTIKSLNVPFQEGTWGATWSFIGGLFIQPWGKGYLFAICFINCEKGEELSFHFPLVTHLNLEKEMESRESIIVSSDKVSKLPPKPGNFNQKLHSKRDVCKQNSRIHIFGGILSLITKSSDFTIKIYFSR